MSIEQTRPAAAGGCSRQGPGRVCRCALLLISHLAGITALSLLSSPHSATAICSDQLACHVDADRRSLGRIRRRFSGGGHLLGFWGRAGTMDLVSKWGGGAERTRASKPMTRSPLQSSQSLYGTPARICAPAPRQTTYVSLKSRRESRDRVSAWELRGPFPRLLARSIIVGLRNSVNTLVVVQRD